MEISSLTGISVQHSLETKITGHSKLDGSYENQLTKFQKCGNYF